MLAENFLTRDYLALTQPLSHCQVAPILFLWTEKAAVQLLGFSEWSLRLVSAVSGIASLFLFRHLATRLLRGAPLLVAVGVFSIAYYPIRHAAEVKPYESDLLVALVLISPAVEWWRCPQRTAWLWALTLAIPPALAFSFPATFVAGGISVGLLFVVVKKRCTGAWIPYIAANVLLAASFLLVMRLSVADQ